MAKNVIGSQPKANVKGSDPKIGTHGNTGGNTSTGGGQFPFMPSPGSYEGTKGNQKGGTTGRTEQGKFPFLPSKPE